MLDLSVLPKRD